MLTILEKLNKFESQEFGFMGSSDFREFILREISENCIWTKKEVLVEDRGDGRKGRIDLIVNEAGYSQIAIELDRKTPRKKSIFKLKKYNAPRSWIIMRSPFRILEVKPYD